MDMQRLHFPAPFAVRQGHVTCSSQLSVSRYAMCHFQARASNSICEFSTLSLILPQRLWKPHVGIAASQSGATFISLHTCVTLEHGPLLTCMRHITSEINKPLLCWVPEIPGLYLSLQHNLDNSWLRQPLAWGLAYGRCSCFFLVPSLRAQMGIATCQHRKGRSGGESFHWPAKTLLPWDRAFCKSQGLYIPKFWVKRKKMLLVDC